jgi:hypothetical protein
MNKKLLALLSLAGVTVFSVSSSANSVEIPVEEMSNHRNLVPMSLELSFLDDITDSDDGANACCGNGGCTCNGSC